MDSVIEANFEGELRGLINKYSLENESDTADFVLARYLVDCLKAYNRAVRERNHLWRQRTDLLGG